MAYPIFSEISTPIYNDMQTAGGSTNTLNISRDASKLVTWVRLISGTGNGLIMSSNPDIPIIGTSTYDASTQKWSFSESSYGTRLVSGMIGYDWNSKPVYPYLTPTGGDLVLRPSPLITAIEIKEGKDQISREAKVSIKCFSLAQCEMVQDYCMEPGHSLLIEYGWNTAFSAAQLIDISDPSKIVDEAAESNLNQDALHAKRVASNGDYDSFLGFIVGGNTASEGDAFSITIDLRGMPGLPTFLQTHHTINPIVEIKDASGKVISRETNIYPTAAPYNTNDIEAIGGSFNITVGFRRYKWMYNKLPAIRQTPEVQKIVDKVGLKTTEFGYWDLVNFDYPVTQQVQSYISDTVINQFKQKLGLLRELKVGGVSIPKDKLVSENQYINFAVALNILNANNGLQSYKVGDKEIKVKISTRGYIGAFPGIFSTKPSKLLIPGKIPDFYAYFLNPTTVDADKIIKSPFIDNSIPGIGGTGGATPGWYSFVQNDKDLEPALIDPKNPQKGRYSGYYEKKGYYGRLDSLYINFKVFYDAIKNSPNKSIRDVVIGMLNEMSSAVNSFWNFQIVENVLPGGDIEMQIIDENWAGINKQTAKTFVHSGEQSIFLEASMDINIPSEMTNQIILKRQDYTSNPNSKPIRVGGVFTDATDKFFTGINYKGVTGNKNNGTGQTPPAGQDPYGFNGKTSAQLKAAKAAIKASLTPSNKSLGGRLLQAIVTANTGQRITEYKDSTGKLVYTEILDSNYGTTSSEKGSGNLEGARWDALLKKIQEVEDAEAKAAQTNITANLAKIDIVPNPERGILNPNSLDPNNGGFSEFNKNYKIYCCDDTQLFDILRNNAFEAYLGYTSHPLPIKYTFKVLGKSGLRRGDIFNIWGIPKKYRDNGFFQIINIEQNLSGNQWFTTVTGQYRQSA
jgi:hypothetical protein